MTSEEDKQNTQEQVEQMRDGGGRESVSRSRLLPASGSEATGRPVDCKT